MPQEILNKIRESVQAPDSARFELMRDTRFSYYVALVDGDFYRGLFCIAKFTGTVERIA